MLRRLRRGENPEAPCRRPWPRPLGIANLGAACYSPAMTMPFAMPDWLPAWVPPWVPIVVLVPLLLFLLAFLFMPFSVIGVKGRLETIEARLDEIQGEIRSLALRLPEPLREPVYREGYDDPLYAAGYAAPPPIEPALSRPPIPPAPYYTDTYEEAPRPPPRPDSFGQPYRQPYRDPPRHPLGSADERPVVRPGRTEPRFD